MLTIRATSQDGPDYELSFDGESAVLGRAPEAELRIDHQTLSRRHARLSRAWPDGWELVDLQSKNGLFVGGARVQSVRIRHGTQVTVGNYVLHFALGDEPAEGGQTIIASEDQKGFHAQSLRDEDMRYTSRERLTRILRVGEQLHHEPSSRARLERICAELVGDLFNAQAAFVLEVDRADPTQPREVASRTRASADERMATYISRTLMSAIATSPHPVLGSNQGGADQELSLSSEAFVTAMACRIREQPDGRLLVLYATVKSAGVFGGRNTNDHLLELSMIAEQLRAAEAEAARSELLRQQEVTEFEKKQAQRIQRGLLPDLGELEGLGFALHFEPCREVGGDYADIIELRSRGVVLALLADVAGKGLHAAMVAAQMHSLVHGAANIEGDPTVVAEQLNQYLLRHMPTEVFATAVLATRDSEDRVTMLSAGHPPALLWTGAEVTVLPAGRNVLLGVTEQRFAVETTALEPGQRILVYSDGLSELANEAGELLGVERLAELFAESCRSLAAAGGGPPHPRRLVALIEERLAAFRGDTAQGDDQTYIIIGTNADVAAGGSAHGGSADGGPPGS